MTTSSNNQQTQLKLGPVAQQLTKLQSNGHQTPSNGQYPQLAKPPKKTASWTGFSGRTLWDWLQFFAVLAIPFIVAAGTLYFTQQITQQQAQSSIAANERQHQTDIQIATDQQREDVLVNYQKDISELILNYHLASSKELDPVREVARAKTLIALRKLDPDRKTLLIQFLYEAQLINLSNSIISLTGTDLNNTKLNTTPPDLVPNLTNLASVNLNGAYLLYTNIDYCDLRSSYLNDTVMYRVSSWFTELDNAKLIYADLQYANLFATTLTHADLSNAQLNEAVIDGVDFSYANLNKAILFNANIDVTNFSHAILSKAFLQNTKLIKDNLSYVDFRGTDFTGVNLEGSDLSNSNLYGAKITANQLAQAKSLHGTIMPDGSIHP